MPIVEEDSAISNAKKEGINLDDLADVLEEPTDDEEDEDEEDEDEEDEEEEEKSAGKEDTVDVIDEAASAMDKVNINQQDM
jgi:DNA-binding transcriptional MerR regulator